MAASLAYGSGGSWFDPTTGAVRDVSVYYYIAGTLDPITVYTTSDLGIPHAIPVLTTGHGRLPPVWISDQPNPGYRMRAFDQWSTLVEDVDNIPTPAQPTTEEPGSVLTPEEKQQLLVTGDIVLSFSNAQPRPGFVLCNGGSIGKATSTNVVDGGSANDDNEALFLWLWGQDLHGMLPVLPSRGSTAQGDWDGGKAIRTPDLMGRFPVGMDAMGAAAKNRLAGITFAAGDQLKVGSYGGAVPIKTLTLAEMPTHNHGITDATHSHSGTTSGHSNDHVHYVTGLTDVDDRDHTHYISGYTDVQGQHTHTYSRYSESGSKTHQGGASFARENVDYNTGANGAHQHTINFWSGGRSTGHHHGFSAWSGGTNQDHTHVIWTDARASNITVNNAGSGTAWQLMAPYIQLCFHIKL